MGSGLEREDHDVRGGIREKAVCVCSWSDDSGGVKDPEALERSW